MWVGHQWRDSRQRTPVEEDRAGGKDLTGVRGRKHRGGGGARPCAHQDTLGFKEQSIH